MARVAGVGLSQSRDPELWTSGWPGELATEWRARCSGGLAMPLPPAPAASHTLWACPGSALFPMASASVAMAKHKQILSNSKAPSQMQSNLTLRNPSDQRVCFKAKTAAPHGSCVRPNRGITDPGCTVTSVR